MTPQSPAPGPPDARRTAPVRLLRPWHFVLAFGLISLLADMVYEGARAIIGPYLATLGASATIVGLVAGAGEFIGYGLRVLSGYAVGHTRHYWIWTISGYALTVASVPLIGATGALAPALLLYGTERLGKAIRSPAKDTLLSYAATRTGRGSAFGVHQALDQTGAMIGPLLLAAILSWKDGDYHLAFASLAIPGVLVLVMLFWLRHRVPDPQIYEKPETPATHGTPTTTPQDAHDATIPAAARRLPPRFWQYVASIAVLSFGVAPFPLLAFHAQTQGLLSDALVPVVFAVAMATDGVSGLLVGRLYDRLGPWVLLFVPIAAGIAAISFGNTTGLVWGGIAVWGVVNGILDSTAKAMVTELVPGPSRAKAFGWLALVRGIALLAAGGTLGAAYGTSIQLAAAIVVGANILAFFGLLLVLQQLRRKRSPT